MFIDSTIKDYLAKAASDEEVPGGGSVSSLVGALGNSMGAMAANFTLGKKKYAEVEGDIKEILNTLAPLREKLAKCVDDDAVAFKAFGDIYSMPKNTDEEKAARTVAMQNCLKNAMAVPLDVMRACTAGLEVLPKLADIGNQNLISDTGVSAILAEAAVRGAYLNVAVNLKFIKDDALISATREETAKLLEQAKKLSGDTCAKVNAAVGA